MSDTENIEAIVKEVLGETENTDEVEVETPSPAPQKKKLSEARKNQLARAREVRLAKLRESKKQKITKKKHAPKATPKPQVDYEALVRRLVDDRMKKYIIQEDEPEEPVYEEESDEEVYEQQPTRSDILYEFLTTD